MRDTLLDVLRVSAFQDVGFALNPLLVEGQIDGGIVQGLGWGLLEGLTFHEGAVINDGFLEYKIPTALDAPELNPVMIEVPSPDGPYGVKGVGEPSMVACPTKRSAAPVRPRWRAPGRWGTTRTRSRWSRGCSGRRSGRFGTISKPFTGRPACPPNPQRALRPARGWCPGRAGSGWPPRRSRRRRWWG